jgi:hypothetical protein
MSVPTLFFFVQNGDIGVEGSPAIGSRYLGARNGSGEIDRGDEDWSEPEPIVFEYSLTSAVNSSSGEVRLVQDRLGNRGGRERVWKGNIGMVVGIFGHEKSRRPFERRWLVALIGRANSFDRR